MAAVTSCENTLYALSHIVDVWIYHKFLSSCPFLKGFCHFCSSGVKSFKINNQYFLLFSISSCRCLIKRSYCLEYSNKLLLTISKENNIGIQNSLQEINKLLEHTSKYTKFNIVCNTNHSVPSDELPKTTYELHCMQNIQVSLYHKKGLSWDKLCSFYRLSIFCLDPIILFLISHQIRSFQNKIT